MSENVNNQYDFFKNVNLDENGNLCVVMTGSGGSQGVTGATGATGATGSDGDSFFEAGTGVDSFLYTNTSNANTVSGNNSSVLAGETNTVSAASSNIVGGISNTISVPANTSSIFGGSQVDVVGPATAVTVVGAAQTTVNGPASNITIFGGLSHTVSNPSLYTTIVGGQNHIVDFSQYGYLLGGKDNSLTGGGAAPGSQYSGIIGGEFNTIDHISSVIIQAKSSNITRDSMGSSGVYNSIFGGQDHNINVNANSNNAIIGGNTNTVSNSASNSVVIGGSSITATVSDTVYVPNLQVEGLANYSSDQSANYTSRSLVDKAYVDANAGGSVTVDNGLTDVSGTLELGGTLTKTTTLSGGYNELNLGSTTDSLYKFSVNAVMEETRFMGGPQGVVTTTDPGGRATTASNGYGNSVTINHNIGAYKITGSGYTKNTLLHMASNGAGDEFVKLEYDGNGIQFDGTEVKLFFGSNEISIDASGINLDTDNTSFSVTNTSVGTSTNSVAIASKDSSTTGSFRTSIISSDDTTMSSSYESTIMASNEDSSITASFNSSVIGAGGSTINTASRSVILGGGGSGVSDPNTIANVQNTVILGGHGIAATQTDTAYVPNLVIKNNVVPTSTSDVSGEEGQISFDGTHMYYKTSTGWGRVALDFSF